MSLVLWGGASAGAVLWHVLGALLRFPAQVLGSGWSWSYWLGLTRPCRGWGVGRGGVLLRFRFSSWGRGGPAAIVWG